MSGAFLFIIYNLENGLPTMLLGSLIGGVALVTNTVNIRGVLVLLRQLLLTMFSASP